LGDSLTGFNPDLTQNDIDDHLANPLADPHAILGRATTRLVYDLFAYHRSKDQLDPQPSVVYTLVRETHGADLAPNQQTKIQHSFSYSDGFGREIQQKIQAEPGPVPRRDANGEIIVDANGQPEMTTDDIAPRWVGSGWKVFNNKGKPVRQYEPFFTDRHGFEFDVRIGVSLVLFYDPVERVVATLHPNHTYGKVVFDPWQQTTWDVNDTVTPSGTQTGDPRTDSDVAGFMRAYFNTQPTAWETWHKQRITGGLGSAEEKAATKAAAHADTPAKLFLDSLGRSFLTVADNGPRGQYKTRVELDIEGNQRAVIDANGRTVMRYDYHMLGNQVRQESMDAGTRWTLNNVAGNPIDSWDSLARVFQTEYDLLQRPLRVQVTGADPTASDQTILTERLIYGEQHPQAESLNLRGQLFMQLDQAGSIATRAFDFKGNPLEATRRLIGGARYKEVIDWIAVDSNTVALPTSPDAMININALTTALDAQLENRAYTISTEYDALNRATAIITPDNSVTRPAYNEANLLDAVTVDLQGSTTTPFVTDIDYNARGQRLFISYGNTATTTYEYDPETFRLTTMRTTHTSRILQDLHYSHDPVGNIMSIRDGAQQTHYFNNSQIEPHTTYTYDAVYQLIEARGREHIGQSGRPEHTTWNDEARMLGNNIPHPNNPQAMRRYTERYAYDAVGNIIDLIHSANNNGAWSRSYAYEQPNNRLTRSIINPNALNPTPLTYDYDAPGNMISMPHLSVMEWDYRDQLQQTARQVVNGGVPQITFYVYDSSGQRIRKVTENSTQRRINERIYLGGYEIYREYSLNDMITLERETLHIMDDQQRIALVEIRTEGNDGSPLQLIRYQFSNHLGSASLELNQQGLIVSYEEYHPYGSTSYQAVTSQIQVSHKRYRYTGMERDEENGFNYHGARYYAPWLGRWISADPAGLVEGVNLYAYVRGNPIKLIDYDGFQSDGPPGSKSIMGRLRKFGNRFGTKIVETVLSVVLDSDPKNPAVDPVDTRGSVSDKKAEPSEKPTDRHKKEIQADKKQKRKGSDVRKSKTKSETVWWSQQDIADDIARQNKGGKPPSKPPSSSPKSPSAGKVSKATKSAKLSKGVRAALTFLGAVPDLTDVGFMFIAAAADIVATKEKMKSRQYNSGFRIGLAAVLLGRSDSNIKGFLRKTARKGEAQIFWGADMGLLEKPYNAGLVAGYAFANDLTTEQSIDVLKSGFAALESEGYNPYTMGGSSTDSFVEHFARALKPTVDKLFEEAAKAQAEEEARRTRELLREHQWTGIMGNKL
jgi:RHS repeat-associated protein